MYFAFTGTIAALLGGAIAKVQAGRPCLDYGGTNDCKCEPGYTPYVDPRTLEPTAPLDDEVDYLCYPTCAYCFNDYCFHYTESEIRCVRCTNEHVLLNRSCWKQLEFGLCNLKHEGDQIIPTCYQCSEGYEKIGRGCYRSLARGMCFTYKDSYQRMREHCASCSRGWSMAYGDCICAGFGSEDSCFTAGAAVAVTAVCTLILSALMAGLLIYFLFVKGRKAVTKGKSNYNLLGDSSNSKFVSLSSYL